MLLQKKDGKVGRPGNGLIHNPEKQTTAISASEFVHRPKRGCDRDEVYIHNIKIIKNV